MRSLYTPTKVPACVVLMTVAHGIERREGRTDHGGESEAVHAQDFAADGAYSLIPVGTAISSVR